MEEKMTTKSTKTISQRLNAAQLAIGNSLSDAEIQSLVAGFGYSTAKLNAGKALYDAALSAVNAAKAAAGTQQTATQALAQTEKSARDSYQALAKVARAAFLKDKAQLTALGLSGPAPKDTAGFLAAAYTLFDNAQALPALEEYGYDQSKLQSERAQIAAYDAANQRQEAAKGAAQQATREQDASLKELDEWLAQYLKIAKVALRVQRQLLEKIGIAARTSKTAAQRAAPRKAAATRAAKKA
jgi:hypothetical protein